MRTTAIFCVLLALYVTANAMAPLHVAEEHGIDNSYIVVFDDTVPSALHKSDLAYFKTYHSVKFVHTYSLVMKGFSAIMDKDQLMAVRNHPRVKFVEQNKKVFKAQACPNGVETDLWGLNRISIRALDASKGDFYATKFSKLGEGVDIYVIDTGTNIKHVDFGGRATWGFTVPGEGWDDNDDEGHGTHVSSTTAGATYGIARKASVIAVKVLGPDGGSVEGVIAGIEYAVQAKQASKKPSVGNMSLGGGASAALDAAVNAASKAGLIMVVAAGNSNANACTSSPARATGAICVGATTTAPGSGNDDIDQRASFSNYGSCVTLFAPGQAITGAWIGSNTATSTISGTSMASPHVAGVVALLLGENPNLTFDNVKDVLTETASLDLINLACTNTACRASPNLLLYAGCEK